ncbi:MAG: hypothetical protein IT518_18405 [Burkholderiales bacterium]|nr:hypothetical protein [Burkholderiales bacterium]
MTTAGIRDDHVDQAFGPWNPGISSQLTPELWSLCTIFRPDNVLTSYAEAVELATVTGLSPVNLVAWRPERMVQHEVLVRVIADYEVPDPEGAAVASLGVNFRGMTRAIQQHLAPHLPRLVADYASGREAIARIVEQELAGAFGRTPARSTILLGPRRWFRRVSPPGPVDDPSAEEERLIERLHAKSREHGIAMATYGALIRVISAVRCEHGRLWGTPELLAPIVTGLACNTYCAEVIADAAGPLIAAAAAAEGFRPLPPQDRPIAFSTKGASAAGKSTMRPLLRSLAARMGARWSDFALISPDIFRRDLLDIDSLGPRSKYFGMFTSHELEVVDRKLDRHLDRKAAAGALPHMLIDRFRFDSFAPHSAEQRQLLARLGMRRLVYYLFMITPPEQTVERAWNRGRELGRYKALDDILAHNADAYSGMQAFFLARALHPESGNQHYEFVDNDVPRGEVPLSVAFGTRGELNILDVKRLAEMDRYRRINVDARSADELYPDDARPGTEDSVTFVRLCAQEFPVLNLAQRESGRIYARFERGRLVWNDPTALETLADPATLAILRALAPQIFTRAPDLPALAPRHVDPAGFVTLGRWGSALHPRRS